MSWFSQAFNWIGDTVSNAIPNEIKNVVSDIIPNEIEKYIDPRNLLNANLNQKSAPVAAVAPGGGAPTYDKTLLDAFNAQLAIEPKLLEANKLFQPQWLELQKQTQATTAKNQMDLMAQLYPQSGTIEAAYQNQLRRNQLQQLQTTLPQYQQAFNSLTPGYAQAINTTGQLAQQSMQRALQAPQLTAFEDQVGSPYRTPAPQQAVNFAGQMLQGPQWPPPVSAMQSAPSQLLGQAPQGQPMGPQGPQGLQQTPAGGYVDQVQQFQPANVGAIAGTPQEVGYLDTVGNAQQVAALAGNVPGMSNLDATRSAELAAASAGRVPGGVAMQAAQTAARAAFQAGAVPTGRNTADMRTVDAALEGLAAVPGAENLAGVAGPRLQSGLENVNQGSVDQYLSAMPGMQDYARMLAQQSQAELSAGRGLTAEEQRMADQSARSAYAARGTALGGQAINAEILNRADVSNQRYQQRLQNAVQAAGTIQGIYQPALAQSLQRQQAGLQYDIGAQGQAFNQAQTRDTLAQAQQAQQYAQTLGAQTAGFSQAQARDTLSAQLQAQRYGQLTGTQQIGFSQAQAKDVFGRDTQAQKYSQAMGAQAAGFGQAQNKDTMAAQLQQQRYNQLTGSQQTAFSQAGAREGVAQQIQQQRYGQAMGQQELLQGAQGKAFEQAMGREGLAAGTQQTAFNQALQRGQSQQQRLQAGTNLQAGQAQLGAGALGQLQQSQAPILQAYYQQPILQQTVGQAQTMGLANQQAAGNTLFQPESSLAFQSAFLPYQGNIALQQAQIQADASKQAGKNSMFGNIGGSVIGALPGLLALCWVAREVYGTKTSTWKMFRAWLLNEAPEWLVRAYIKHGPDIAEFIKDKPVLKSIIRKWMDSKIESYITA